MPTYPWPPHRGPFLAEGGKDWQEKDPAGALLHPGREVSRPLPHPDSSSASFCRGDPKRLSRPQVLVCVRVRRAAGRACYITLGSLRLGARWGRSLMTTLPPPAHHLVAHPLFSSHLPLSLTWRGKRTETSSASASRLCPSFLFSCWLRPLFCSSSLLPFGLCFG